MMSDQRIEYEDWKRRSQVDDGFEVPRKVEDYGGVAILEKQHFSRSLEMIWPNRRRDSKKRREYHFGTLVFALCFLLQVIGGLGLSPNELRLSVSRRLLERQQRSVFCDNNLFSKQMTSDSEESVENDPSSGNDDQDNKEALSREQMISRIIQLEGIVAQQAVEIQKLKKTCDTFSESLEAFTQMVQVLKEAGLQTSEETVETTQGETTEGKESSPPKRTVVESFDDAMIFGTAPSSVIDAADAAGAAILAAMLGGKQRMLVDVRDAELSTDSDTLVQFIELAILPIAAGLEGLKSTRNRLKIVFPKVSQLLEYRRTMALAAPEVVALSTLGFEPVEKRDKLVVVVAPAPDDEEGLAAMNEMLYPSDPEATPIQQPIVLLNHHMVPIASESLVGEFEKVYHLRLLSVQYMSGGDADQYFQSFQKNDQQGEDQGVQPLEIVGTDHDEYEANVLSDDNENSDDADDDDDETIPYDDAALEAAMQHAHEVGTNLGSTRAMVIRAYPR